MKAKTYTVILFLVFLCGFADLTVAQKPGPRKPVSTSASIVKTEKEEFDFALALPPAERIEKLKAFIVQNPRSTLKMRAMELIVSAHATLGDEKLQAGDAPGGIEQFRLAVAALPSEISDKLFTDVVSRLPTNLFLRGQPAASVEVARAIDDRVKDNGMRLLTMAAFYIGIESAEDAIRVADLAIKLKPEVSAGFQARAAAHRIALRLEESAADYARALELSPTSDYARRSLAELRRATGKTEEALALYREILKVVATDEFARTGLVISLFELGRKEEAEREFGAALKDMPNSLALLAGTAYWFAAHNDNIRAIELAQKAVQIEPRYTWSHIALARALLAEKRPMEAERELHVARTYGRFPTLDYEMASVLAAAGLYGEASTTLSYSFALKQDLIETWLAGRVSAHAGNFLELLAPERRASIFQFTAADNETNARSLKMLMALTAALNPSGGREAIKESDVLAAAREFIKGDDDMRAFRRLYVASRLLEYGVALPDALEIMEAVTSEVEPALRVSAASIAVMGEELRDARAQANTQGSTLNVPVIPRLTLSNIMRGRIEDLAGWILFHQGKYAEAVVRLRRATSVLPDKSVWWRNSMWHLGASLDASGKGPEALDVYYRGYLNGGLDPTRRAMIESLYRRINGSLKGLDDKIGPPILIASNTGKAGDTVLPPASTRTEPAPATTTEAAKPVEPAPTSDTPSEQKADTTETKPSETAPASDTSSNQNVDATGTKPTEAAPKIDAPSEPKTDTLETKPVEVARPGDSTSESKADAATNNDASAVPAVVAPTQEPTPASTPVEVPPGPPQPADNDEPPAVQPITTTPTATQPVPAGRETAKQRPRRAGDTKCSIAVSESGLTIQNNGGRVIITITLDDQTSGENVTAATSDWSSLAVFPEPKGDSNSNSLSFSVTSISKKTGLFTITFKTPCGSKDVAVTVR